MCCWIDGRHPHPEDNRLPVGGRWCDPVDPRRHGPRRRWTQALLLNRDLPAGTIGPTRGNTSWTQNTRKEPDDGLERQAEEQEGEAKGAAKEKLGKATDDEQMERQGQSDQSVSNLKQAGEKVKDAFNKDRGSGPHRRYVNAHQPHGCAELAHREGSSVPATFLTWRERGNPSTQLDARHRGVQRGPRNEFWLS